MTYDIAPAGHEETVSAQDVRRYDNPDVTQFIEEFSLHDNPTTSNSQVARWVSKTTEILEKLSMHEPWSQKRTHAAIADPRLFQFAHDYFDPHTRVPTVQNGMLIQQQIRWSSVVDQMMAASKDDVLIYNKAAMPRPDVGFMEICKGWGERPNQVIVCDISRTGTYHRIGRHTNNSMFILGEKGSLTDETTFLCCESLIVDLTGERAQEFTGSKNIILHATSKGFWEGKSLIPSEQPLLENVAFNIPKGEFSYLEDMLNRVEVRIQKTPPKLQKHLEEVMEHSADPYSLHRVYGLAPGPSIGTRIRHVLELLLDEYHVYKDYL